MSYRKPKLGEDEVSQFAPYLRDTALQLPRSYRERALKRFKAMAIDISNPSDQQTEEIRTIIADLVAGYQHKALRARTGAARKRLEVWNSRNLATWAESG